MEKFRMWDMLYDNSFGYFKMFNVMKNKLVIIKWGNV